MFIRGKKTNAFEKPVAESLSERFLRTYPLLGGDLGVGKKKPVIYDWLLHAKKYMLNLPGSNTGCRFR